VLHDMLEGGHNVRAYCVRGNWWLVQDLAHRSCHALLLLWRQRGELVDQLLQLLGDHDDPPFDGNSVYHWPVGSPSQTVVKPNKQNAQARINQAWAGGDGGESNSLPAVHHCLQSRTISDFRHCWRSSSFIEVRRCCCQNCCQGYCTIPNLSRLIHDDVALLR